MSAKPWPYPAPTDDGAARHLVKGRRMPAVSLASTRGWDVALGDMKGWAVLFFYTWTGRPGGANPPEWDTIPGAHGSTVEIEGIRNLHSAFTGVATSVFAISTQATDYQREMAERLKLDFDVLSDENLTLAKALRLPTFETGGATYLKRLSLVVKDTTIVRAFYPVHPPDTHPRALLAWLTAHVSYAQEQGTKRPT